MTKEHPNCKKCKWMAYYKTILTTSMICQCQGFKDCSMVYNNKECKAIYKNMNS